MSLLLGVLLLIAIQDPARGWVNEDPNAPPERVTIEELLRRPGLYHGHLVLVTGRLREGDSYDTRRHVYELRDEKLLTVKVYSPGRRQPTVVDPIGALVNHDVEVVGFFSDLELEVGPENPDGDREDRRYVIYATAARKLEPEPEPEPPDAARLVPGVDRDAAGLPAPPTVVGSHPASGERGIPLDADFVVKFSYEMDPQSFEGNVHLVYVGASNEKVSLRVSYEPFARALRVAPTQSLRRLSEIRLVLYRGIVDARGRPLVPSPTELLSKPLKSRRATTSDEDPRTVVVLTFFTRGI